ncbi:MAG: hypothetical protein LBG92_02940 [Prevotellaceae bacterium]|jgi:metal-responsive CopG/Arc/MetJ family transcriptional regulator|nr:hypothetical protein [Prevotellaceae bacterium]
MKKENVNKENVNKTQKRVFKTTINFNMTEMKVIDHFLDKYRITNRSKFFRESIISTILKEAEENHPKLF